MEAAPLFLLFVFSFVHVSNAQTCRNENGIVVDCVSVYDCPVVLRALETRPLLPSVVNTLRRLQCGFRGANPLVCCPSSLDAPSQETTPSSVRPTRVTTPRPPRPTSPSVGDGTNLLPTDCGTDVSADKIYNGQITDIDEFPWMALLGYRRANGSQTNECGGALINKRYVLTAAHCVTGEINRVVGVLNNVRLGEYNVNTSPDCVIVDNVEDCADDHQDIGVEEIIAHPGFSDVNVNRKDDIALIRLARDVKFSFFINPICLSDSSIRSVTNDSLYVAGWGRTLGGKKSDVKLKLIMPQYEKPNCDRLYSNVGAALTDNQICAGGEFAKDTCGGDSGGPLMKNVGGRWYSLGIVSFGNGCGRDGWPGVYTSVTKYLPWIRSNLRP